MLFSEGRCLLFLLWCSISTWWVFWAKWKWQHWLKRWFILKHWRFDKICTLIKLTSENLFLIIQWAQNRRWNLYCIIFLRFYLTKQGDKSVIICYYIHWISFVSRILDLDLWRIALNLVLHNYLLTIRDWMLQLINGRIIVYVYLTLCGILL